MQSLIEYLAAAPKTHLAKLHRREFPEAGLMPAVQVVEAVRSRTLNTARILEVLTTLDSESRRMLLAIYSSEERGMLELELVRGSEDGPGPAGYRLSVFEFELLAFSRDGEHRSFHGFLELLPILLPVLLDELVPPEEVPASAAGGWISNVAHATAHLCHFLARVAVGELRLTQAGELHRKSLQELAASFSTGAMLSSGTREEEATFLFHFATDTGLVLEFDGLLHLSDSAHSLEEGRADLQKKMADWWLKHRLGGLARTLDLLRQRMVSSGKACGVLALARIFQPFEGWGKPQKVKSADGLSTWENLPRTLRELWLLGGVEFALSRGRIHSVRLALKADKETSKTAESPRGLPNFDALVPVDAPWNRQFQMELLARRDNDERLTRFRFTKETVVAGLQAGVTVETLRELAAWLGFGPQACRTLSDWASSYATTSFQDLFLLRVRDASRFRELEEFPQFMELVSEVIPGFGFAMSRADKTKVCELLRVFDLLPGEESRPPSGSLRPVPATADAEWTLPTFVHGEMQYRHVQPVKKDWPAVPDREAGKPRTEETLANKVNRLEGAIRLQRMVEFIYNAASVERRIRTMPLHVLRNREPMKLIGVDSSSGHRNEYILDSVQGLRIFEEV